MRQRRREQNRQHNLSLSPGTSNPPGTARSGPDTQLTTAAANGADHQDTPQPSGDNLLSASGGKEEENGSNRQKAGGQDCSVGDSDQDQEGLDISMESIGGNTQEDAPVTQEASAGGSSSTQEASEVPKGCSQEAATATSTATPREGLRPESPGRVQSFLFKSLLNVKASPEAEEGDVLVEMHWVEGQNKDLMNQLCTCLKNSLLRNAATSTTTTTTSPP